MSSENENLLVMVSSLEDGFQSDLFSPREKGSVSSYKNACGKYVALQIEDAVEGRREEPRENDTSARTIGKIVHKNLEYYHEPQKAPAGLAWDLPDMFQEALRIGKWMFEEYAHRIPTDAWGEKIRTEVFFPRTQEEKQVLAEVAGSIISDWDNLPQAQGPGAWPEGTYVPFKFIVDGITYLDEDRVQWWNAHESMLEPLPGPGWYIIDFKTSGKQNDGQEYIHSHQRLIYTAAIEELRKRGFLPEMDSPLQGMIFSGIFADKRSVGKRLNSKALREAQAVLRAPCNAQ